MQNAPVNIPNGAICCKLWPKPFFHATLQNPVHGVATPSLAWVQVRLRTFTGGSSREIFGAVRRVLSFISGRSDLLHWIPHGAPFGIPTWEAVWDSPLGIPYGSPVWESLGGFPKSGPRMKFHDLGPGMVSSHGIS